MQAFKEKFNPKVKNNHVPYGMFFTQIIRNIGVDVSGMALFGKAVQLKRMAFLKMRITDNFPEYAQKHIKRKVKNEPKGGTPDYG